MENILQERGIIKSDGQINKDKINLVSGAITQPFAETVWCFTGGDRETINRITELLILMDTPTDRKKLFKVIQMLYGVLGLKFPEEAAYIQLDENALKYFMFSFAADFGDIMQAYFAEKRIK